MIRKQTRKALYSPLNLGISYLGFRPCTSFLIPIPQYRFSGGICLSGEIWNFPLERLKP
jgi:hypothetical protein